MKRQIIITSDGSTSIHIEDWNESYHSKHGAIQEAYHVFIKNGLNLFESRSINILEIGFGTGLNTFITFLEHRKRKLNVNYQTVEAYPLTLQEAMTMNYVQQLNATDNLSVFEQLHTCTWEQEHSLCSSFRFKKRNQLFQNINDVKHFDLIYFDAFGARVQPELWNENIFRKMFQALKEGGYLVTYSAKGSVRRAMQACGFKVEKLQGPPGKREMLRARK
ncbi:tRNA (5-methylaminomethyl-2-thiouridine)(34)-methyltransferase MnmD [Capnocytophaga canimorsus]|uniref:tRNA (5-methylaminomethyl-2-thiouridine)(34)-methyltransferase MnmD n=1 Tax=Capnocytophaga canimorsus TaxID=28188 RepID=UPI0037D4BC87